ncbi:unnamed protein product [Sympodiomycopsis kandeliae]
MSSPTGNLLWQEVSHREDASQQLQPRPAVGAGYENNNAEAGPSTPRKTATRTQKAVAACTGAVTTSLLMTPFDVVKTRLQTQSSAKPLFSPSSHLTPSSAALQGAPASAASSSSSSSVSASATCCHSTFFTGNAREQELTCKFDPRLSPGEQQSRQPVTQTQSSSTRSNLQPRSAVAATATSKRLIPPRPSHFPSLAATYGHTTTLSGPSAAMAHSFGLPSSTCAFPDKRAAVKGLAGSDTHLTGLWDGVVKVHRAEGPRGLWRGLSPTLLMTVPSQVTYMTCYEYFRGLFLSYEAPAQVLTAQPAPNSPANITYHTLLASLLSGAISRSVSATLVTPLELVRTRLQASDTSHTMRSILASLSQQVSTEGPSALWRGLPSTLWRDVPFSAIYFMGYESMKRIMTGGSGLGEGNSTGGGLQEFNIAFISGATSGTVAAVVTHPFDLVKTQLQAQSQAQKQTIPILKTILKNEGIAGLFKGLSPRIAKVAPACGLMIGSYEAVGTLFASFSDDGGHEGGNKEVAAH